MSFLIALGRKLNIQNHWLGRQIAADYTIIKTRTPKATGNHVMYDRGAWFLRVIMSSSGALLSLLSVKKQKHFSLVRVMNLSLRRRLITPASTLAILDMTKKNSSSDYLISLFRLLLLYVRVLVSGILARTTPNVKAVLLTRVTAVCFLMDTRVRLVMKVTLFTRIGRFTTFKNLCENSKTTETQWLN